MQNISAVWLYPIILIAGGLQAWGPPMGSVETLVANFGEDAAAKSAEQERQIAAHIAASEAFVLKYGSLANEFHDL